MSVQTLLIGLDGATFDVLDPLMESGEMPFLRSFCESGVRANLRSVVPALTPPAWTSMVTGVPPGCHGVFDFFRMQSKDDLHIRFFNSNDIGVDTLWTIARDHGLRVTCLNFPATFPAPHVDGYVVPGWVPWRQLRLACWPEDLFDTLKRTVVSFNPRELAMDIGLEERATEGCSDHEEYASWIELHTRREQHWFDIFRSLTQRDPSGFTAVLFDGVDKLQHLCWRFLKPSPDAPLTQDWEFQARNLCLDYFRKLDKIIEKMCEQVGPEATIMIASDHGFQATSDVFHVNSWLASLGYLRWNETAPDDKKNALLGVGQVARHTWQLDWTATTAFAATPTSNGIYIVVNRDGNSPGILPTEYDSFRSKLLEQLDSFRHPETGQRVIAKIWTREQIFNGPHLELAPDITLEMVDGGLVSIVKTEATVSSRPAVAGAHAPLGVFAARGPRIRAGVKADEMSILDVAPAILNSLDIAIPQDMQGRLLDEIYVPLERDKQRPARRIAAAASNGHREHSAHEGMMSPEDEETVMNRLRELGYIE